MKEFLLIFFILCFFTPSVLGDGICPEHCECDEFLNCTACDRGYYDTKSDCENDCLECPGQECFEEDGNCTDVDTECLDSKTYGINCKEPCTSLGEGNCELCDRKGKQCLECKNNITWGERCDDKCNENCPQGKCRIEDGKCMINDEYCGNRHFHGDYCNETCYDHCLECLKDSGDCTKCEMPFYSSNCSLECKFCPEEECHMDGICTNENSNCINDTRKGPKCNQTCSEDASEFCEKCNRDGTCTVCHENKYWDKCNKSCNDHCPDDFCEPDGKCNNKVDNCYNNLTYEEYCLKPCNESHINCSTCDRQGNCLSCLGNKTHGSSCDLSCENCPDGLCDFDGICLNQTADCLDSLYTGQRCDKKCSEINESCYTCNRNETCLSCTSKGFYGDKCNETCLCPQGECEIDGTCIHYDENETCLNDGLYGQKCDKKCDEERPYCKSCNIFGKCLNCSDESHFGYNCSEVCDKCPEQKCYINGTCINQDDICADPHFYDVNCTTPCNGTNIHCNTCLRNGICDSCSPDNYWGPDCDKSCEFCPGEQCDVNGTCLDNTTDCVNQTKFGDKCDIPCNNISSHCKLCRRNKTCLECNETNYYGENCTDTCNNCPNHEELGFCDINGICHNKTGLCIDPTMTGDNCSVLCKDIHENCLTCNRSEICLECINRTKFGGECETPCDKCPINGTEPYGFCNIDGICDNKTGLCTNNSYTGETCSELCSDIHENCFTCDREAICSECITKTRFGNYCNSSCDNCPGNPGFCSIDGICDNLTALCDDDTYTGENCSVSCSSIYPNCFRCDRDYECSECTNYKIFGPTCNSTCETCPGGECYVNGTCIDQTSDCDDPHYYGEDCLVPCYKEHDNCDQCHRNSICFECIDKSYYGENCEEDCRNCPGESGGPGICYNDGVCVDQNTKCNDDSLTGEKCDEKCMDLYDKNCKRCDRKRICLECDNRTYYGNECRDKCFNCPGNPGYCNISGICDNQDDLCDDPSFTGEKCNKPCTDIDKNCDKCDREEKCYECKDTTKYGDKCQDDCSNCPNDHGDSGCHNNGTCKDLTSLCIDDTKYGPGCNVTCKNISNNCQRCNRNETCTECTESKFHGDKCLEGCYGCSEKGCNIKGYCREFECQDDAYGLGCDQKCECFSNSYDGTCGKFRGQCANCKFGYFGKNCSSRCSYKCQTELCCLFKEYTNEEKTKLMIKTNYKTIDIKINNQNYKFEIDYNYGFPLTIFNTESKIPEKECEGYKIKRIPIEKEKLRDHFIEEFTNYNISSYLYSEQVITVNGTDIITDIAIADTVKCLSKDGNGINEEISGVIGLGFFNSISNAFFVNKSLENYNLNILSFNYNEEEDEVELLFGNLFDEQINYIERLTSCKVILDSDRDIQGKKMTCELDGIKSSKYSEAFKLKNAYITFSLGENSSLILGNDKNYTEYLRRAFFNEDELNIINDPNNPDIQYILYPNNKINKLYDFGFVFNNFSYSYSPDTFFLNTSSDPNDETNALFLIKINKNSNRTEFVIGKEFFRDIKFTINNEEAQIYFYAQNAEYCATFTDIITDSLFNLKLNARETAAVCLAIIIAINLIAFMIYYFVKRRKMKSSDYVRIE